MVAAATRTVALFLDSGHTYVQRVRNALCWQLWQKQRELLPVLGAGHVAHTITSLSIDETEFIMNMPGLRGSHSVMMLHGHVFRRTRDGNTYAEEIAIPPAVLEDKTATTVLAAIKQRAGWFFPSPLPEPADAPSGPLGWVQQRGPTCAILISDSAATLINVASHLAAQARGVDDLLVLHARCLMHRMFGAFVHSVTQLDVINPMYCATCLLHKGHHMRKVKEHVEAIVRRTGQHVA